MPSISSINSFSNASLDASYDLKRNELNAQSAAPTSSAATLKLETSSGPNPRFTNEAEVSDFMGTIKLRVEPETLDNELPTADPSTQPAEFDRRGTPSRIDLKTPLLEIGEEGGPTLSITGDVRVQNDQLLRNTLGGALKMPFTEDASLSINGSAGIRAPELQSFSDDPPSVQRYAEVGAKLVTPSAEIGATYQGTFGQDGETKHGVSFPFKGTVSESETISFTPSVNKTVTQGALTENDVNVGVQYQNESTGVDAMLKVGNQDGNNYVWGGANLKW
jgi:hypothetical protein